MIIGKSITRLAMLSLVLILSGCASKPTFTAHSFYTGERLVRSIYIYSFLDLREQEVGSKFLREFKRELAAQLDGVGVKNRQLWFNDSPARAEFSKVDAPMGTTFSGQDSTTRTVIKDVPIGQVVQLNSEEERTFNATHRLIVFPENTTVGGVTGYQLRWDIIDARTGKLEWTTRSTTQNGNWWSNDEAPVERARVLVEGLISELRKNSVLPEAPSPGTLPPATTLAASSAPPVRVVDGSQPAAGSVGPSLSQAVVENPVGQKAWIIEPEQSLPPKSFQKSQLGAQASTMAVLADVGARENPQGRPEVRIQALSAAFDVIQIPAGRFAMGSSSAPNESPVHAVEIRKPFWMGKFPVTQRQWLAVMKYNPSGHKSVGEDAPVERVSQRSCQTFIARLNQAQSTWRFRLPSEAEWEYACRAGTTGDAYGGLDAIAWYRSNANAMTHPVGQKQPNAFGLYDMLGNVWQWCEDLQHDTYDNAPTDETAWIIDSYWVEPAIGRCAQGTCWFQPIHVTRGGSWREEAMNIRSAKRQMRIHKSQDDDLGFRLVCEPR